MSATLRVPIEGLECQRTTGEQGGIVETGMRCHRHIGETATCTEDYKLGPQAASTKTLFHDAWGQAKNSPDYDKQVWLDLQAKLGKAVA